ncbi:MAG: putative glycoside hydrolase [Patescibacteria group bacterium]|jgi:hypothetical protein
MNRRISPKLLILFLSLATIFSFFIIAKAWQTANAEIDSMFYQISETPTTTEFGRLQKPEKQTVKGVYLTAYSAGSSKKVGEIIDLINRTELNAVVIDIKDYSGLVLFNTKNALATDLHLKDNRYPDLAKTVKRFHDNNIYVIARQTVFQDPVLAEKKPAWAIKKVGGGLWRDRKGLAWVDPSKKEVWDYNVALAKEVIEYGVDEINFDYIRFPSDGNMKTTVYSNTSTKKYKVMGNFYKYLTTKLADEPAYLSFDMFGFVMEKKGEDDMNIGQRMEDALPYADYICPMMYPSHYPPGHLKLANPAAFPALVLNHGLTLGAPRFEGKKAELRPWIQAFDMGAIYDGAKIRAQINEVEKFTSAGWLLWNASNRYTAAGLKAE